MTQSNERLEFLGDSIVGFVVADAVVRAMPNVDEGTLSRTRAQIVRRETLAQAARSLQVERLLVVGASEAKQGGRNRDSLLANAYEALVGTMFLDHGFETAHRFVHDTLGTAIDAATASPPDPDPKTRLQMLLQGTGRKLPEYRIVEESGQGHDLHFVAEVLVEGEPFGRGEGASKRSATAAAARAALEALEGG